MRTKSIFFTVVLIIAIFISGCHRSSPPHSNKNVNENTSGTLKVYTTIFPIEDFTKKIGGKYVDVKSVYPAGADAHTFEPTLKTMMNIADADIFIYNGAGFETFIDKAEKTFANEKVKMAEASNGIELLSGHDHDHDEHGEAEHGNHDHDAHMEGDDDENDHDAHTENDHSDHDHHHDQDPHVWLDPIHAIKMAENIKEALSEAMPSAKDEFEQNFQDLKQKLEQLDVDLSEVIEATEHKDLLVSHASYGYWEHRYGIHQISITGLSPENEPSQKHLQNIIETAKKHNIHFIIYDQVPSAKVVNTVQKETGTKPITLHNLEYITEDDKTKKEDYFSLMNKNIDTLKIVLEN
ncbi:adhesin [Siminovitchia terrae]|uniref:Adhesin n=1 Tax=Siminovitchia terrae TaxID=1914933 RepID=A0ABQ4KTI5_SIMTE|nr:zinc ABC transporter substrate-binding protein [Siminovitchia terrae]GIN94992.1 adhesin [Siminovitchia terrae]